ncbi:porin [Pelagibacteraceae bacterium]|nr:porin [Pelagibacteraceae bacterium]
MKKELLMGTALVSTLGAASVAEAVTATMSGNHQTGMEFDSPTGGTDTNAQINDNNFSVSLSETTDGGMTISSSFSIVNESTASSSVGSADMDAGFTLAFTDGSKLDVINAGNASGSHAVSVPGSAGAEGVANTSSNMAPTGLDFATTSTVFGVEYHTAADFLADGLKASISLSTDNGATATSTYKTDSHIAVGATYVTDLGDSAVTIGGGYSTSDGSRDGTMPTDDTQGMHVGLSAVTGDLTVAVGFADGSAAGVSDNGSDEYTGEVVKAGVKYVSGDLTFNVGITSGEADDHALGGSDGDDDGQDVTSASVSYAVAAGVTAILGYTSTESSDEGSGTDDGSAWYIGANMAF